MTSDENIQRLCDERSRLLAENRKLKAIISSAMGDLDHGFLISARTLSEMREAIK